MIIKFIFNLRYNYYMYVILYAPYVTYGTITIIVKHVQ